MSLRILRKYIAREVYAATLFVFVAFLALFAFFDLINELGDIGKGRYTLVHALVHVVLLIPAHVYELAPIAVLIGTLYALSHFAANSEFTIMRSAGLAPSTAVGVLFRAGVAFVVITFAIGELVAPMSERMARELKLQRTSAILAQEFRSGLWVKDENRFVNVREVLPDSRVAGVRIYEFSPDYRLQAIISAKGGEFGVLGSWLLADVERTIFGNDGITIERLSSMQWISVLTPDILTVLFVVPERMSAWSLYQYSRHLVDNRQKSGRYEVALWRKLFYPFAVLVMMALALPFAYVHSRTGGLGAKVFVGIMLGILFHMLNSLFSHLGLLQQWPPFISAALPSIIFLLTALGMMWFAERR